ncbi:hypothetical protein VTP01DRAFT_2828 [Rhizomucor pusillus]|uniref:uncharacterized protein n=1 Tax=Rhizomucor pusillus TaxID=4840 RepID=UPI0013E757E1
MYLPSLTTTALVLLAAVSSVSQARPASKYTDPISWDAAYKKAEALVNKMSLDQKVGLATGMGWEKTNCVGNTYASTDPDFPSLCLEDSPLGIRFGNNVSAGVSGINAAASFDKVQIRKRGEYIGEEAYGKGVHAILGPCVDVMRAPSAGRAWEAFGEDPYLAGIATIETVNGIQSRNVIATAKHFIGNNQEENRTASSSNIGKRALHEIWLWPYARAVEAGVGSVMCAYNLYNGTYACENEYTLNTVLKGELGFRGFVQSDWGATHSTAPAVNAGLDMTMPGDINMPDGLSYFGANLTKAVKNGEVSEDRVTDMAVRIAAAWYKMGQDNKNFPETTLRAFNQSQSPYVPVQDDHATLIREMGAASTVLLTNKDSILPLNAKKLKSVAIIGSDAGPNPNGPNSCPDRGCDEGTLAMGWGSGTADFPYLVTPKEGIEKRLGKDVDLKYTYDDFDTDAAAELAKDADIALVFSNADSGEGYITVDGNEGDRKNLTLWKNGDNLIKAVADVNENTVVVIHAVGPVLMPWIDHPNIKAIVWPGLPGQETGNSLADVLFGDVNPSGRLPYTIAKSEEDYPAEISHEFDVDYTEGLYVGYRHFDAKNIEPLFPFGYGLSYTNFTYSKLKVKKGKGDKLVSATITIKNTGDVDGAEIPQAYITFPESAGEPFKNLRGFEKVFLKAGKSTKVTFEFSKTELSIWDESSEEWTVPSGEYTLQIGASSRDIRQTAKFTL